MSLGKLSNDAAHVFDSVSLASFVVKEVRFALIKVIWRYEPGFSSLSVNFKKIIIILLLRDEFFEFRVMHVILRGES